MKKQLLLLACAALFIASCNKDKNEVLPSSDPKQTLAELKSAKPFSGSMTYNYTTDFNLPCDCGAYFPAGNFYGTGNLTHLGNSSSKIKPCFAPIFAGNTQIGLHTGVECASFVAANGDELFLYTHPYDLYFTAAGAVGVTIIDFVGGTGRFSAATGSFSANVTITPSGTIGYLTGIAGTINY